jgi:hypothetical protein
MVVPGGHRVEIHGASFVAGFARSAAGVWLAHLGGSTDEKGEEVDRVLGEVEGLLGGARPHLLLAAVEGPISSLMAPASPKVAAVLRAEPRGVGEARVDIGHRVGDAGGLHQPAHIEPQRLRRPEGSPHGLRAHGPGHGPMMTGTGAREGRARTPAGRGAGVC